MTILQVFNIGKFMTISDELHKVGLKVTLPRIKIMKILDSCEGCHMSAEMVMKKLEVDGDEVGLATVYRVLTQFEKAGLVKRQNFENGHSVFEIDNGSHHDHLVCVKCGMIEEFIDDSIEAMQSEIANDKDFIIIDHSLTLYGICSLCKKG